MIRGTKTKKKLFFFRTTVRLGEYDTQQEVDCIDSVCADRPQEIRVASAYPHPGYSDQNKNRRDDIGIVRLATRATFSCKYILIIKVLVSRRM